MPDAKTAAEKVSAEILDYWITTPEEGYVVKTRYREVASDPPLWSKIFVNICHDSHVPPPMDKELDEEVILRKLDADPTSVKVPTFIGELENTHDFKKVPCRKIDVIINSIYYKKRVEKSEFYRQLIFMIVASEIERVRSVIIDTSVHKNLRKLTHWGEISKQRIRKTPEQRVVQEEQLSQQLSEVLQNTVTDDYRPFEANVIAGRVVEIIMEVLDDNKKIDDVGRLRCRVNDDRILIIVDNKRAPLDVHLPFRIKSDEADVEFDYATSKISVRVPIVW